jgi:hypothetical protein
MLKSRRIGLRHREHAVRVFYLLLIVLPFAALALLSLLVFLGVLAVGGAVHVAGVVQRACATSRGGARRWDEAGSGRWERTGRGAHLPAAAPRCLEAPLRKS